MKIKEVKKTEVVKTVETSVQIATFSRDDIQTLILKELASTGYNVDNAKVTFHTSSKYVTDEWGMNSVQVRSFDGVTVEFSEAKEN